MTAARRLPADDAEVRHLPVAEAEEVAHLEHQRIAERLQRVRVERLAPLEIGDVHCRVIDWHGGSSR
jgi:hypothetical protein